MVFYSRLNLMISVAWQKGEPMRLIDADALREDCKRYLGTLNPDKDGKECTRIHWLIGVLENAPTIEPEPCEDAVSRNAIIQKLNTMDRYVSEELILCDTDKKFPKNEVFIVDDVYEEIVENLPSAQPDNRLEKIADFVEGTIDHFDRDDAMDLLYQIKEVFK